MAGTDHTQVSRALGDGAAPTIILVEPQIGENIGKVARAMLNCGLTEMRVVQPREADWQTGKATATASGATIVLEGAREFDSLEAASEDLTFLYAATARPRDMVKVVLTPEEAMVDARGRIEAGRRVGVVFGPERAGLVNDAIAFCDAVLTVPLNPSFSSLNLAQAVLVVGYESFARSSRAPSRRLELGAGEPATKRHLLGLFEHLEAELDDCGFLRVQEKRPSMVRNLRNILGRAELTDQEVSTLRGVIACLVTKRKRS